MYIGCSITPVEFIDWVERVELGAVFCISWLSFGAVLRGECLFLVLNEVQNNCVYFVFTYTKKKKSSCPYLEITVKSV